MKNERENNEAPLTDWVNEPTVRDLKEDMSIADPARQAHASRVRDWISLRDVTGAHKPKTSLPGRSKVQPKLVRRQNEWRYPALSDPFLAEKELVQILPRTFEDGPSADQNKTILQHQVENQIDWQGFIDSYIHTATDEGTVAVKVGWERETYIEMVDAPVYSYYPVTDEATAQKVQQAAQLQQENPRGFLELPEDLQESVRYSLEKGQLAQAVQTGRAKVEQERVLVNQPVYDVWEIENLYVDPTCNGKLKRAKFCVFAFETSKADLQKDGRYQNLDKVLWSSADLYSSNFAARSTRDQSFKDELRRTVVAYEYWGFYDIRNDGRLVPIVATWIGDVMIRMELNPFPDQKLPLVMVPYLYVKNSLTGEPDAELLGDNQAILGAVTRGMIDLMAKSANGQTGMAKGMLDAVNKKRFQAGGDYEFNPGMQPAMSFYQHKFPEIPQSALTMLQLQNQEAEALTGVKAFSGGIAGNAYGDVAAGIRGMLDAASKREMSILRRLAAGILEIFRKTISMNGAFLSEEEVVRVTNETFITIRREDLAGNFDFKINITTPEIEEAKAQDLAFLFQTLGPTVDFSVMKLLLIEFTKLKKMPELTKAIERYEPQPDPLEQQLKQLEIAKLEAEIQEIQSRSALNAAKAKEAQEKADALSLGYVEQATGTTHAREMDKANAQARANENLEITKRILDPEEKNKGNDLKTALQFKNFTEALTNAQNT